MSISVSHKNVCLGLLREYVRFYGVRNPDGTLDFKLKNYICPSVFPDSLNISIDAKGADSEIRGAIPVRGILFSKEETSEGLVGIDLVNGGISYPIAQRNVSGKFLEIGEYVNLEPLLNFLGMYGDLSDSDIDRLLNTFLLNREWFSKNEALFGRKSIYFYPVGYVKYRCLENTRVMPPEIGDMIAGVHSIFTPKRRTLALTKKEAKHLSESDLV